MAFPADSAPPARTRPAPVTYAVWALYALAATQILSVLITVLAMGPTVDATREYVEGKADGDAIVSGTQIVSIVGIVMGLVFAIVYAVLAVFINRGSQPARITAWVVLGISLCCNGFGLLGTAAGGALSGGNTGDIDQDELQRRIEDAVPGWFTPVNYLVLILALVATIAAIILLALPAAHPFFRKQEQNFEPPLPGSYYPQSNDNPPGGPGQYPGQPGQQGPGNPPPAL